MKKKVLLIDDTRDESSDNIKRRVDIIARNYWDGINCLKMACWDVLLLDHDLNSFEDPNDAHSEKTGYDIMLFFEEFPEYLPKKIILVTSNPVGRDRMMASIRYLKKNGHLKETEND